MYSDAQLASLSASSSRPYLQSAFRSNPSSSKTQPAHLIDKSPHKFGTTPMTAHSPNKSPVLPPPPIPRQQSPSMHHPASSQKTLQQKLAEQRQKSLQQESKKQE